MRGMALVGALIASDGLPKVDPAKMLISAGRQAVRTPQGAAGHKAGT